VELEEDDAVFEEHGANNKELGYATCKPKSMKEGWSEGAVAYVHANRNDNDAGVEAHEIVVFLDSVAYEAVLDLDDEVVVEAAVDEEDDEFGDFVPDVVDVDEALTGLSEDGFNLVIAIGGNIRLRDVKMGGDPDAEDGYVDDGD